MATPVHGRDDPEGVTRFQVVPEFVETITPPGVDAPTNTFPALEDANVLGVKVELELPQVCP